MNKVLYTILKPGTISTVEYLYKCDNCGCIFTVPETNSKIKKTTYMDGSEHYYFNCPTCDSVIDKVSDADKEVVEAEVEEYKKSQKTKTSINDDGSGATAPGTENASED